MAPAIRERTKKGRILLFCPRSAATEGGRGAIHLGEQLEGFLAELQFAEIEQELLHGRRVLVLRRRLWSRGSPGGRAAGVGPRRIRHCEGCGGGFVPGIWEGDW